MYDGGLYQFSILVIDWCIGDIPHNPFCNHWLSSLAVSRISKQNNSEIFLAIDHYGDCRGNIRYWINVPDLVTVLTASKNRPTGRLFILSI